MVHADRVVDAKHLRRAEVRTLNNNALRQHHSGMHFRAGHGVFDGRRFNLQRDAGLDAHVDAVLLYHVRHRLGAMDGRPGPRENAPRATDAPLTSVAIASRWRSSACSSTSIKASPLPSCIAPGQFT